MSVREFTKSSTFVILILLLVALLLPFAAEQIGEATGLWSVHPGKWLSGLFSPSAGGPAPLSRRVDWNKQLGDLATFSDWAAGKSEAKISIVRPEVFQIVRADPNPATAKRFSWKLQLLSERLDATAAQVRNKLSLICDPDESVSGEIVSVKPLAGGEKGFLVTVDNVRGEGKIGLSYAGLPPVYYDVKLRRMWLVPVAGCRSAVKGRCDAAVFFPGIEMGLGEGSIISPGSDKCGYRILSISDSCVWFEAFYGAEPLQEQLPHSIWPDFSRVDTIPPTPPPGRLVFGKSRCFWPGDAIKLPNSGTYLMVDDLLDGRAAVFRMLDSEMRPVRELLCVIVREKK
ncbi:MAG: hypothetical protein ACI4R9_04650 [Kiritimatiellia bacterium]